MGQRVSLKRNVLNHIKLKVNQSTAHQNVWGRATALLNGHFCAPQAFIRQEASASKHLKNLEKQKQNKPKTRE